MASATAKKLAGTHITESARPVSSMMAWAQDECRTGSLRGLIERFARAQVEPLDVSVLTVEEVTGRGILAKIPFKTVDHESKHPFLGEVWLRINPLLREVVREVQP